MARQFLNELKYGIKVLGLAFAMSNLIMAQTNPSKKTDQFKIGDTILNIEDTYVGGSDITYVNLHDNENTSVKATKEILKRHGGRLIELKSQGNRLIDFCSKKEKYSFDPNRIFSKTGIEETLKKYNLNYKKNSRDVNKFGKYLTDIIFRYQSDLIVAVHNNTDGNYSITSYLKGGGLEADADSVFTTSSKDLDDFFFVTKVNHYNYLKKKGNNVVLQNNQNVQDDGSLSVYCGYNGVDYINVEAQHGHIKEQIKMLEDIQEIPL